MANANYRDARVGFAIYFRSHGAISIEELNELLKADGYGPIAQRTMTHYKNLLAAGFNRYISINRFDVARASRAYDNMSNLSRYKYRRTNQDVTVIFTKRTKILEVHGKLIEIGDVGAIVEFSDENSIEELKNFKPSVKNRVVLYNSNLKKEINGVVLTCDMVSQPILVEFEYNRLVSVSEIEDTISLPSQRVRFNLLSNEESSVKIDVIGRRLYHFFELLEGIRALYNETSSQSKDFNYAPPPLVSEIKVASPATLVLQFPPELVALVSWPLLLLIPMQWIVSVRKTWHEGTLQKKEAQLTDVKKRSIEESLTSEIVINTRIQLPESRISEEELMRIVQTYILPPYRDLARSDVRVIEATIDDGPTQEENDPIDPR